MSLRVAFIALLLQVPTPQQPVARAAVAGVILNGATGAPLPNVRVTLARTDLQLGPFVELMTSAGGLPPMELNLSAETLAAMGESFITQDKGPGADARAASWRTLPFAEIHEVIVGIGGSIGVVSRSSPPALTNERGQFAFNNVEPGTYRVIFGSEGFSKRDYGQRTEYGEGIPMVLVPGQEKTDIVMRLMPVASVTGRLRDAAGQPAVGVPVHLFRMDYDESGKRTVKTVAATHSDDRGEYRMYFLPSGRYYLSAGHPPGSANPDEEPGPPGLDGLIFGRGYFTANRIPQKYATTYYPGAVDLSSAIALDVQAGSDLRNVDFLLDPRRPHRVRGRLVDESTGRAPQMAAIAIMADTENGPLNFADIMVVAGVSRYEPSDGTFEIRDVSPGRYSLTATMPNSNTLPSQDLSTLTAEERSEVFRLQMLEQRARPKASTIVNVANADVDGVLLTLGTGQSIDGRFRVETIASELPSEFRILRAGVTSTAIGRFNIDSMLLPAAADGTFRLSNLQTGEYRLSVEGVPAGFHVKHARLGAADLLNGPLRVSGPISDTLDILISPAVASVEGIAHDAAGQPAPGAQVVLIPQNRGRNELFRAAPADSAGRFMIRSVAPGDYILAAWDAIEPFAFFDPDLIRQAERQGKAIRVAESNQTVTITSIPATGP